MSLPCTTDSLKNKCYLYSNEKILSSFLANSLNSSFRMAALLFRAIVFIGT